MFRMADSTIFRSRMAASFRRSRLIGGFWPAPVTAKTIFLAPAERADIVVDFSRYGGEQIVLQNGVVEVMQFRVARTSTHSQRGRCRPSCGMCQRFRNPSDPTRYLTLEENVDVLAAPMIHLLNGARWHEPVTEKPVLGTTEIWAFVNLTEDSHPIHLHLVRFQILDRRPFDDTDYQTHQKLRYHRGRGATFAR